MKKKHIRTIIITVLVLILAATAVLSLDIKPAVPAAPSVPAAAPSANIPDPTVTPDAGESKQPQNTPSVQFPESEPAVETTSPSEQTESPAPAETAPAETEVPEAKVPVETPSLPEPTPEPVPEPTPDPTPTPEPSAPERHICTIEIRCDTVVDTSKLENQAVAPFVPASGVILATFEVEYTPGESVFDILLRATMENNIHMEFRDDNLYSGKYIEGINYLYEMDGGPLSGWMYKVNGQFPNYGCAAYKVNDGDAIVWMYTCDLGLDVGDNSTW